MNKTFSTLAAAAVLMASTAIAPALAQTTNPATPASPAAPADPAMGGNAAAPATSDTSADMAAGSGSYLTEQSETQISANDYIGKPVYNSADESIGDVNDLILETEGGIVAAVIGVGGFLGIGEKDVAVPMDLITMSRDTETNDVRLTTTETAESLEAAPEFMTLDDQQAAADSAATDASTTSATGTAPMPDTNATTPPTTQPNN
ncbi:PRC-barrel domain-containing protein [Pseudorhizobium pelagicum]|uniref:Photosystem reaction center subunit H n=1 Tax=Pseudorhizobium pelagicum TaxID=1509405 RepID=A0A922P4N1_9HYPH|nr:PRC-barrel domain-containing protein [Pseudorhizobium pelagicum]KEQ10911.1 photosystem reaction center subunit H [Pseudorhizobium pelagicum]